MKISLKRIAAGICVCCMVCLGKPNDAAAESGTAANKSSANLRFVIHIPQTLSMRIARLDRSNRHLVQDNHSDRLSVSTHENEQTIEIEVLGNVLTGGAMALNANTVVPQRDGRIKLDPQSSVTWNAKGFFPSENRPHKDTDSSNAGSPTPHTFTFSDKHHFQSGPVDRQIVYTISAP